MALVDHAGVGIVGRGLFELCRFLPLTRECFLWEQQKIESDQWIVELLVKRS